MISHVLTKVHDDPSSASEIALNKAFWTVVGSSDCRKFVELVFIIIRALKDNGLETILEEMSKLFSEMRLFKKIEVKVKEIDDSDIYFIKWLLQCLYFMAEYNLDYMKNVPRILKEIQTHFKSGSVINWKNRSIGSRMIENILDSYMIEFLNLLSNHVTVLKVGGNVNAIIPVLTAIGRQSN